MWLAACLAYQQKWTGHQTIARQGLHIMTDDPTSVPWPGPGLELVQDNPWPVAVADWDWIVGSTSWHLWFYFVLEGDNCGTGELAKSFDHFIHWPIENIYIYNHDISWQHDVATKQWWVCWCQPWGPLDLGAKSSGFRLMFISRKRNQSSTEHEVGVVYTTDRSSALQNRCLTDALVGRPPVELAEVAIKQLSYWNLGLANKNKRKNFGNVAKILVCCCHLTNSGCGCKTCKWAGGWKYDHTQLKHKLQQAPSGMLFSL